MLEERGQTIKKGAETTGTRACPTPNIDLCPRMPNASPPSVTVSRSQASIGFPSRCAFPSHVRPEPFRGGCLGGRKGEGRDSIPALPLGDAGWGGGPAAASFPRGHPRAARLGLNAEAEEDASARGCFPVSPPGG